VVWCGRGEGAAEVHTRARDAEPIPDDAARCTRDDLGPADGWKRFQWLVGSLIPDPSVVG